MTALGNMATEGMILTNHDHQIRVGVLTGNREENGAAAAAAAPDVPQASLPVVTLLCGLGRREG